MRALRRGVECDVAYSTSCPNALYTKRLPIYTFLGRKKFGFTSELGTGESVSGALSSLLHVSPQADAYTYRKLWVYGLLSSRSL